MAGIDKTTARITALEREMAGLRAEHDAALEARNHAGVLVIDRNDELCIL
jgi:hypothetical protein